MKKDITDNQLIQYESFFWSPDYLDVSAWIEHIPFAFWVIEVLKPKSLVELGVHTGVSYFSFCQAVKRMNIDTVCYGVDTWEGDEHAGFYSEEVFEKVMNHNAREFSRFSTLIRSTFDEAKEYFIDGSVDLLHIDGLHTYEAVKHDFDAWLPKLSSESLVVFHDINVREKEFGVFKFWEELKKKYLSFQFDFGHGLGVLAIGKIVQDELKELFSKNEKYSGFLRNLFSERGNFFKTNFNNSLTLKLETNRVNTLSEANAQLDSGNKSLQLQIIQLSENHKMIELANGQLQSDLELLKSINKQFEINYKELAENIQQSNEKYQKEISEVRNENELFKKYITWYRETYENRSILGVLKEKIRSSFKKKIHPNISQNDSPSKTSSNSSDGSSDLSTNEIEEKISHTSAPTPAIELQMIDESEQHFSTGALNIRYQEDVQNLSDVCIFSSYSFAGKVEEYVFYYLAELKKAGFSIVFVSTSMLAASCINRLSEYAYLIIERENKCPDFGSWKAGLSMLEWGEHLNSVLLTNDSVFGPLTDLGTIISSMKDRYDIWGMSDNYEIDYHLQSYFLYFNRSAIASDVFKNFWKNVDQSATKDEVIHKYEIGISRLFRKTEFKLGAYANIDIVSEGSVHGHKVVNPLLVFWKSLIKTHQFPFFKRELIIKKNISRTYDDYRDLYVNVGSWKRTIEENSSYPVTHIVGFMNNYYKTISAINSSIVLRKRKILFLSNNAEIGEAQMVLINFLQWLKNETDIDVEIIICKEGDDELAREFVKFGIVTNFYILSQTEKKNLKGRLIDEVALVFSNTMENVDTQKFLSFLDVPQIIFVHEPTSALKDIFLADDIKWVKNNVSQFIASTNVVKQNIADLFSVDDRKVELLYKFDNFTAAVQAPKILQIINTYYDHEELRFAEDPLVAFMIHIYYENSWDEIRNKLKNFDNGKNYFLFSISEACLAKEQIIEDIRESFQNSFFLITSNIGKDIGGKMALIDLYLLLDIKSSYIVFLHDKQSPHSIAGESWKNELFKIIEPYNQSLILDLFKDPKTGMVGAKDHIVNEYSNATDTFRNNNRLSKKLLTQFDISIENYDFLGGSMYWLRSSIIEKFFTKNNPILMRENLEAGNVLDLHEEKLTHTWERMFSWITTNEGYRIEGI